MLIMMLDILFICYTSPAARLLAAASPAAVLLAAMLPAAAVTDGCCITKWYYIILYAISWKHHWVICATTAQCYIAVID